MNLLADIGLTPSEARDISTYPGFVDLDLQTTASWVFVKEKLGFSAYELAKVFLYFSMFADSKKGAHGTIRKRASFVLNS